MKFARAMACLVVAGSLSACASVDLTKTASGYYAPTDPNVVQILKTVPPRKYVELGTLTVTGFDVSEVAKMHNAIRGKASVLGADAVILSEEGIIDHSFSTERWATGVAIHYTDVQAQNTASPVRASFVQEHVAPAVDATSPSPAEPEQQFQTFDQWQHSSPRSK